MAFQTVLRQTLPIPLKRGGPNREPGTSTDSSEQRDDNNFVIEEDVSGDENKSSSKKRKKRLSSIQLSEIIVEKDIKTRTELFEFANKQKLEEKFDGQEKLKYT